MEINNKYVIKYKGSLLGYLITISSLLITTSPFFNSVIRDVALILIIFLIVVVQLQRKNIINTKIILIMGLIYGLIIVQGFLWGFMIKAALYYPVLVFFMPFLIFSILGTSYFRYLFNVIYFTAIYTFFLWLFQSLVPAIDEFFLKAAEDFYEYGWDAWPRSLIFYTTGQDYAYNSQLGIYRNSGIFHEPGAYSIFLMIAIIINTILKKNPIHSKNIVLGVMVLTTFSTVGYLMIFVFALYSIPRLKLPAVVKFGSLLVLVLLTINTYNTSYFLRDKVQSQYSSQSKAYGQGKVSRGRFYSGLSSFYIALKYPLTGRNILTATNIEEEIGKGGAFGYGFVGLMAKFGVIFAGIYLWFFYQGLRKLCLINDFNPKFALVFFIIINLGLLTQVFMVNAVIVIFFLTGLLIPKKSFYVQPEKVTDYRRHGLVR